MEQWDSLAALPAQAAYQASAAPASQQRAHKASGSVQIWLIRSNTLRMMAPNMLFHLPPHYPSPLTPGKHPVHTAAAQRDEPHLPPTCPRS